jgi:ribosomal protein S18 acetylase RimI-like enzyme
MFKIEQTAYPVAQTILGELATTHVAIAAALDGTIDAEVWLDQQTRPEIALVANGDAYYLAGNASCPAETLAGIRQIIPDWAYLFVEEPWLPQLGRVWSNAFAIEHPRIRMGLPPNGPVKLILPPVGFELVPIDRALFARSPGNLAILEDELEGWQSPDAFFDAAIGYCVLHDGSIASHSLTDSVSGTRCEIGVGTVPEFRRLGIGRAVASATVAECVRRGLDAVEWHSHASNKGSLAIGAAIGLVERDRHTAHSCSLPAENPDDLDPGYCLELARHFEKASEAIDWCRFHAAGAWALAGEHARALENARLLIEGGWEGEAEWLEAFWALRSLGDDPAFQALLSRQRALQDG